MFYILASMLLGVIIGVIAGLCPGIHPNTFATITLPLLATTNPLYASIFLLSSTVVNSFVSTVPSILLGAPEDTDVLGVLPGHKMLINGKGYEAIRLTVIGSIGGTIFSIISLPIFYFIIPFLYNIIKPFISIILLLIVVYMVYIEKGFKKKIFSIFIFILSGILGIITLNFSNKLIFPLLSGLFGLPLLILAVFTKTKFPEKFTFKYEKFNFRRISLNSIIGSLSGIITGLLPGIGAAQATLMTQQATKSKNDKDFLMALGAVTTANVIYSILALWLIGKGRSGIAVAISELINININYVLLFLCIIIISSGIAAYLTLRITKHVMNILKKINYSLLNISIIIMIFIIGFLFSGIIGLYVLIIAMFIGLIPNYVDVKRTHCMGCLIMIVLSSLI